MKIKNTIFVLGAALAVSFGVFCSSKSAIATRADGETDLGTITFQHAIFDSTVNYINGYNPTTNVAPAGWDSAAFAPVDANSGTFVDGIRVGTEIKKVTADSYYIPVANVEVGSVATVKGTWSNGTYKFTVNPFTQRWNGTKWVTAVDVPELDPYDTITLISTGFEDKDRINFDNTGYVPSAWNTFATSADNTRNSFVMKFAFEAYDDAMDATLTIKVGNSGAWDAGHAYQLQLNNTWGPTGVIVLREFVDGSMKHNSYDKETNLKSGSRHIIEFGSIYVKDSNNTYEFITIDGEYLYEEITTPYNNLGRTAKVGYSYGGNDIFIGSVGGQKENTQTLKYNHLSENKKGIYLDGTINSIPADWECKGVPASKYNALYNGLPMYTYGTDGFPMSKPGADEDSAYYLDIGLSGNTLKEGDVITLSDEFHFYFNSKAYAMSVIPVSFLYSNNQMTEIKNINNFLTSRVSTHCNLEYYDDDKIVLINQIVEEAEAELVSITSMKTLWSTYLNYIAELDAIPYNEEKAREILNNAKAQAKEELNALVDEDMYDETNIVNVRNYVNSAIEEIDDEATNTVAKVEQIVEETKTLVAAVPNKQQAAEAEILKPGNDIPDAYLADYEVVTTTDLAGIGDLEFHDWETGSYNTGDYNDTSSHIAVGANNPTGNMVFQFRYESDNPAARYVNDKGVEYGAHVFIRMRGTNDTTAYRFDIATDAGDSNVGVAVAKLVNDIAVDRIVYKAGLQANTSYKIECGSIDLDGNFNRTLLFIRINGTMVIKTIVDSLGEAIPTIRIMDSFVKAPYMAKLSPVEEDTTKEANAQVLGRPTLDASSNQDILLVSFRKGEFAEGSILYPAETGAFTLNGNEVPAGHAVTTLEKTTQSKFVVKIHGHDFEDGDVIKLSGLFSFYNANTKVKTIYTIYETTFTYSEATNSWSVEGQTDLEKAKEEAQAIIETYADSTKYSAASLEVIDALVVEYKGKIDAATTLEQVSNLLDEGLAKIDLVNTLLDDYKDAAKLELTNYKSEDLYRDEEKTTLRNILNEAFASIDNCNDELSIDLIVTQTKASIDEIKTAQERDAEDLAAAKNEATTEVQNYSTKIEMDRYSDENADLLENMTYQALDNIANATSIEQVNSIVNTYKEDVKNVKTKDGSKFDGDKYIEKKSGGCGGSIATTSTLSIFALLGLAILLTVRKTKEN